MTDMLSIRNCWCDENFRQGWERQLADGRACGRVQRGGPPYGGTPERPDRWTGQGNYSGQPVPAAFGREAAKAPTLIEAPVTSTHRVGHDHKWNAPSYTWT